MSDNYNAVRDTFAYGEEQATDGGTHAVVRTDQKPHGEHPLGPNGHADGTPGASNTISIRELTNAFSGRHPVGELPPPGHGGGVIDPPPLHVGDLHIADHSIDVSALHPDHAPTIHFDAVHH